MKYYNTENLIPTIRKGKLFCFELIDKKPILIDYTALDKEMFTTTRENSLNIGGKKELESEI